MAPYPQVQDSGHTADYLERQQTEGLSQEPYDQYRDLPPQPAEKGDIEFKLVEAFAKAWGTDEKYDGKLYNLLDDKVISLFQICRQMKVTLPGFHYFFPYILTGQAKRYYLTYLLTKPTFRDMYLGMKHFEHDANMVKYKANWNSTKFSIMMSNKKEEETPMDVLENMLDKLSLCQRAMGTSFSGEQTLLEQVRSAVQGQKAFEYAFQYPKSTCEGFFDQLRSSLVTVMTKAPGPDILGSSSNGGGVYPQDQNANEDAFYINRRYYHKPKTLGWTPGWKPGLKPEQRAPEQRFLEQRPTQAQGPAPQEPAPQGPPPARGSSSAGPRDGDSSYGKRCWICDKPGCHSSLHTAQERASARTHFIIDTQGTNFNCADYADYMVNYEGTVEEIDSNDDDGDSDDDDVDSDDDGDKSRLWALVDPTKEERFEAFLRQIGTDPTFEDIQRLNAMAAEREKV